MSAQEARELLRLEPGYGRSELSTAYRRLVRTVHPDLHADASEQEARDAHDLLAQIHLANEVLQRSIRLNASDDEPSGAETPSNGPFATPTSFIPQAPSASLFPTPAARSTRSDRGRLIALVTGASVVLLACIIAAGFLLVG